jgi:hypothetical protein
MLNLGYQHQLPSAMKKSLAAGMPPSSYKDVFTAYFSVRQQLVLDLVPGFEDVCMPDGLSKRHSGLVCFYISDVFLLFFPSFV